MNVIKIAIILALGGLSVWFGLWLKDSVSAPIEFRAERKAREDQVRKKLETIAHLQKMHRTLTERFASDFDSLKQVLTTDTFYLELTFGDVYDTTQAVETVIDTLLSVDSLQSYLQQNVDGFTSIDDFFSTIQDVPNSENYPGYQAGTRDIREPLIIKWTIIDTVKRQQNNYVEDNTVDTLIRIGNAPKGQYTVKVNATSDIIYNIEIKTGISIVDIAKTPISEKGYSTYTVIGSVNTLGAAAEAGLSAEENASIQKYSIFKETYEPTKKEEVNNSVQTLLGSRKEIQTGLGEVTYKIVNTANVTDSITRIDEGTEKIETALKNISEGSKLDRKLVSDFKTGELNREIWVAADGQIWCRKNNDKNSELMRLYATDDSGSKEFLWLDEQGKVWKGQPIADDGKSEKRYWIHAAGEKDFELLAGEAIVEGTDSMMGPSFEVRTFIGFYMEQFDDRYALYDSDYAPLNKRKIGNIKKPNNTSGNW
ncbi:MAG: hypothetical protein MK212_02365 [Saprospiraceae bacterium]|nr:hypothetical protein [Saprospiraceae bacterium]